MSTQEKFMTARAIMSDTLIEREDEVDVVLTAMICRENPLLVGEPGTAKSLLLDSAMSLLGHDVPKFSILMNKFTVPEEVFGPISVKGLTNDEYRRITTGKLPQAIGAFIDEIFKASSAILNTMLRALNERVFENGDGVFRPIPLVLAVGASNEWPNEQEELGALFDRFLLRKNVNPIVTSDGIDRLLWDTDLTPRFDFTLSIPEITGACAAADRLAFSDDAKQAMRDILSDLSKEGIKPGDRRKRKAVGACKAFAYLNGVSDVEGGDVQVEHLEILSHILWVDPIEQPAKCGKVVAKIANPVGAQVVDLVNQAQAVLDKDKVHDAVPKLQALLENMKKLPVTDRTERASKWLQKQLKKTYDKAIGRASEDE